MNIVEILKKYPVIKGKMETIKIRLEGYEHALSDEQGFIAVLLTSGKELGMPRGSMNYSSSSVETAITDKEKAIELIKEWKSEDESRLKPIEMEVKQIERAINSLSLQEQRVVEWKYFENMFWRDIEINFNDKFRQQNYISEAGLKKMLKQALEKLEIILQDYYRRIA